MNEEVTQWDFGGFNPRFLGVSLRFGSPATYKVFRQYLESDEVSTALGQEASRVEIAIRSVLDHEIRHYHDSLISPYGAIAFRHRLEAMVDGMQALNCARDLKGTCVPSPLLRWVLMNEEGRALQLREWNSAVPCPQGGVWVPPGIPHRTQEYFYDWEPRVADTSGLPTERQFELFLDAAVHAYLDLSVMTSTKGATGFLPCHFFEVTALTSQVQAILQSQGLMPALEFLRFLLDSPLPYADLWRRFLQLGLLVEKQKRADVDEGSLVLAALPDVMNLGVWCLLGSYERERLEASPAKRFDRLLRFLVEDYKNPMNHTTVIEDLWAHWDQGTGVIAWKDSLKSLLVYGERGLRRIATLKREWGGDMSVPRHAETVLETYTEEQRSVVGYLLESPELFADLNIYLNQAQGRLPIPLLRVELDGFCIPISTISGPNLRYVTRFEHEGETYTNRYVIDPGVLQRSKADDFMDAALRVESMAQWCDAALANLSIPWETQVAARAGLEDITGKRLLMIVG